MREGRDDTLLSGAVGIVATYVLVLCYTYREMDKPRGFGYFDQNLSRCLHSDVDQA